jgi:hypothetical protein
VREPRFYFDKGELYCEATTFLITGNNIKYICGLLNSNFVTYIFKKYYAGGGLGETGYRYKKIFLEKIPIPKISETNENMVNKIQTLVDQILEAKKYNKDGDTIHLEAEIDELVMDLYQLTPEEREIVK